MKILDRKTNRVKLNGTIVVNSELTNGNKILDEVQSDKNIRKMKRANTSGTSGGDG